MKKAMLVTVGTGRQGDVAHGIAFALRRERPDFVLFIGTDKSLSETLPLVLQETGLKADQYETRTTQNENDVDRSAVEYLGYVRQVLGKGYSPEEIVVDFTSGTKAMSAALVVAALAEEAGAVSYVYGERGEGGRVISGTERINSFEPHLMLAEGKLRWAAGLFNIYQYAGCLGMLAEVTSRSLQGEVRERAELLAGLAEAYQAWDRFDHRTAGEKLDEVSGHSLLPKWGIKRKVETHKQLLHRLKEAALGNADQERAVDLWNNTQRRSTEGKFDDAVARLYRLLEYIGQVKLYRGHDRLIAGNLEVAKLPETIREKYEGKRGQDGKVRLDLKGDYELLEELGDEVGRCFMGEYRKKTSEIKAVLGQRNHSILAHGFGPVGEEGYQRAAVIVEGYMDQVFPGWREEAKKAEFPQCPHVT